MSARIEGRGKRLAAASNGIVAILSGWNNSVEQTIVANGANITADAFDSAPVYDPQGLCTNTYSFTAKQAGWYPVDATVTIRTIATPANTDARVTATLFVNVNGGYPIIDGNEYPIEGPGSISFKSVAIYAGEFRAHASGIVKLAVGDVVSLSTVVLYQPPAVYNLTDFTVYVESFQLAKR